MIGLDRPPNKIYRPVALAALSLDSARRVDVKVVARDFIHSFIDAALKCYSSHVQNEQSHFYLLR